MDRLAANLTQLYRELPFLDRFEAAARDGFGAVELLFPYDHAAAEITGRLRIHGLRLAMISMPPPNFAGGARGFAAIPGGEERFRHDFRRSLRFVEALGAQRLHILAGKASGPVARSAFIANLRWAAAEAPGLQLVIEPRDETESPGYFLNDFELAREVLDAVRASNLGLVFDTAHAHLATGDVLAAWKDCADRVAYVQLADAPGRGAPGSGDIDFPAFLAALGESGYEGPLGLDYRPEGATSRSFSWRALLGQPS